MICAGFGGALAISAAAVGDHLLASDPQAAMLVRTGAAYAIYHCLAILGLIAIAAHRPLAGRRLADRLLRLAGWLFIAGTALFSGGLWMLAAGLGVGGLAPVGGSLLILGWLTLAASGAACVRQDRKPPPGKEIP
ncbi:MAG: DUF423 domain-containing protein [Proteobacteria bacterium]|nr:DUF423 domain-containing protein [Pseudomonadota bacterium]